jgi:hypothetical protein
MALHGFVDILGLSPDYAAAPGHVAAPNNVANDLAALAALPPPDIGHAHLLDAFINIMEAPVHREKPKYVKGELKLMRMVQAARIKNAAVRREDKLKRKHDDTVQVLDDSGTGALNGESVTKLGYCL